MQLASNLAVGKQLCNSHKEYNKTRKNKAKQSKTKQNQRKQYKLIKCIIKNHPRPYNHNSYPFHPLRQHLQP